MTNLSSILSVISMLFTIGALLGGIWAFKTSIGRTANEIQERVITALEADIAHLRERLDELREENTHLRLVIDTICTALKSRGLIIKIDGDMISIDDTTGGRTVRRIKRIQEGP